MLRQTREADLRLFYEATRTALPATPEDVSLRLAVPAFVISELTTAFQMGVVILLPFLIVDLAVSSLLMSMGMMMVPPTTLSLPIKLVLFVLVGFAAILLGIARGWGWIRNAWFRLIHLLCILVVAGEAVLGISCPLTVWEQDLRRRAGQTSYQGDFVGKLVHDLLFFEAPPWVFTVLYVAFATLVLITFCLAPPRLGHATAGHNPNAK
jgi:hypothetical protein